MSALHVRGTGEDVAKRAMPQRHRVVLHREQVLEVPALAVARERRRRRGAGSAAARRRCGCARGSRPASRSSRPCRATRHARAPCPEGSRSGSPRSRARRQYSASSHLMKAGRARPTFAHDLGRDEAEPPAVVVGVHARVHPRRLAQVRDPEVVRHLFVRLRAPDERLQVDGLGERVQHRAVEQVEHVRRRR